MDSAVLIARLTSSSILYFMGFEAMDEVVRIWYGSRTVRSERVGVEESAVVDQVNGAFPMPLI